MEFTDAVAKSAASGQAVEVARPMTGETALTVEQAAEVRERFGTPCYVYDRGALEAAARRASPSPRPSASRCATR